MSQNDTCELFSPHDCDSSRNINIKNDPYFNEKVGHEIHRMMGLLRFSPDNDGVYVARCAPDYYILPALGAYFTARFGDTPWEIIDEKRGLSLSRKSDGKAKLTKAENISPDKENSKSVDEWEELWKHYHKTINNESRNNPDLQRALMPKRYWKYLPEKDL